MQTKRVEFKRLFTRCI